MDGFGKKFNGVLRIWHQRNQGSGKLSHIPDNDVWLVAKSIPAKLIYRGKDLHRLIAVHKGTGTIVNSFPCDLAIVRIHDSMNKSDTHPLRDQACLRFNHAF